MLLEVRKQIDFLEVHIYFGMGNQYMATNRTRTHPTLKLVMSGWDESVKAMHLSPTCSNLESNDY